MLTASVLIPLVAAVVYALVPGLPRRALRPAAVAVAAVPLVLLVVAWTQFDPTGPLFQQVEEVPWIPAVGAAYRLGVDGFALAIATMTALLFVAAIWFPVDDQGRLRQYLAWMLFLEAVSVGLFLSLDVLLFYVFFDLSLVGMYFVIARWGHDDPQRTALKFFLYTLLGSLAILLGILSLALAGDAVTFDLRELIASQPLAGQGLRAGLTLLALLLGFAIKTPLVPVHTWLPAAHVDSPAPGSAILAGVLLKMGVFGMIRIAYAPLAATFRAYALWIAVAAVVAILWGALVALGQQNLKRRIAYTSITHMGYAVLGLAVAALAVSGDVYRLALTGATLELVAHGLITGALFLVTGVFWRRTRDYDLDGYGGLLSVAPWLGGVAILAILASLGLPALAGFVAEFQIFTGALAQQPWLAGIALLGVLLTGALFIQMIQRLFFGALPDHRVDFSDLTSQELVPLVLLLVPVVVIGVAPAWIVDTIGATADALAQALP